VAESAAYQKKEFLLYQTNSYGITLLTDTTERSPTFSLPGFENTREAQPKPSLAFLMMPSAADPRSAWEKLLHREPRALEWDVLAGVASAGRLMGFDFSARAEKNRETSTRGAAHQKFSIDRAGSKMEFRLGSLGHSLEVGSLCLLFEHLTLKLLMNAHSLLVMGRLNRFESNVMTWVRPSNNKLIDRAIRYVNFLVEKQTGKILPYEEVCYQLFAEVETLQDGESVVLKTVNSLLARPAKSRGNPLQALILF
jgi:N-acetylmuramic acid 6-phosphate etherase